MTSARETLDAAMTEDELLDSVTQCAYRLGYLVMHIPDRLYKLAAKEGRQDAMAGAKGFPDLVLLDPVQMVLIVAELKTETGTLTPEQEWWLISLERTFYKRSSGPKGRDGLRVHVWRPSDWSSDRIEKILRGVPDADDD